MANVLFERRPLTSPVVTHGPMDGTLCCLMHCVSVVTLSGASSDQEEGTREKFYAIWVPMGYLKSNCGNSFLFLRVAWRRQEGLRLPLF